MKISVLIIAHNEEEYIEKCITSLLKQTKKPDEILLVVHNSTDKTFEIGKKYPITIIGFNGPPGIIQARLKGLESVTGDIILCIDGDSFAENNWIEVMTRTLSQNNNILVASWVKLTRTFFGNISNITNRIFCVSKGVNATQWVWGPSFAFWGRYKGTVREIFEKSIALSSQLQLSRNPDDYWLALFMNKIGDIEVTNKTYVTQYTKERSSIAAIKRTRENLRNGKIIQLFMKNTKS